MDSTDNRPIINSHAHIFTGDHVPPWLAKTYIPFPFYYLLPVNFIVGFFRFWYKYPAKIKYTYAYKRLAGFRSALSQAWLQLQPLPSLAGWYFTVISVLYANAILAAKFPSLQIPLLSKMLAWLVTHHVAMSFPLAGYITIVIIVLLFFPSVRNMFFLIAKLLWKFLQNLPGSETKALLARYLNIGRYAFHKKQGTIVHKLLDQYPGKTGVIILPMDMEYMGAGKPATRFRDQMEELAALKNTQSLKNRLFPFLFIDPRRCVKAVNEINYKAGDLDFIDYHFSPGEVTLANSFVNTFINEHKFSGFKIYPALGYFPFDDNLLPLWKFAADNGLPITSHCIRGTIFYRGLKKKAWLKHPVFEQAASQRQRNTEDDYSLPDDKSKDDRLAAESDATTYESLDLIQTANADFTTNFTHPMNFLCLLEEPLLRIVVAGAINRGKVKGIREMFGYTDEKTPLQSDLSKLKICIAHFGGDDQWLRYFEKDRYNYSSQLIKYPDRGIDFFRTYDHKPARGKPEQLWKYTDWYSIICSLMLRYDNVYADISYILHDNAAILPLLKQTLQNKGLRKKVLYGTDFFVVRNHKSDKNMMADMQGGLSTEDFDQIARENPRIFLTNKLLGAPLI